MKSRTTAAMLALFLGGLGVHRMYLGKVITGVLYLLFCWTYVPALLGVIEGIYYFILSDSEFDQTYNPAKYAAEQEARQAVKCPHCAELIKREAKVCKHCGRDVETAEPAS